MKRVPFLVLVLVLFAPLLWAGGQQDGKKKIVHFHWTETTYDKINSNAAQVFMRDNPNVEVQILLLPDADRAAKIRTALTANGEIDSFAVHNGESAEFLSAGQMIEILPAAFGKKSVREVVEMWTPGAIETCGGKWKDKYYGIPFELSNYVAWANVAFMREAGLDPNRKPKTWEEFTAAAKKMVKDEGGVRIRNGVGLNSKEGIFNYVTLLALMEQLGLDWGNEKGFLASMDKPDLLAKGISTMTDWAVKDRVWDPGLTDNDRSGFGTGKQALFLTGGSWYWGVLDTYSVPRTDVEPFAYPRFAGGKDIGGVGYGYCLYVSRLARHKELTFAWLDRLASYPNEFIKYGWHQPRVKLSDGSQALDPQLAKDGIPYYNQVFQGELAKTAVWMATTKAKLVEDAVWAALSRVIYQGVSAESSVKDLANDIRAALQ